MSNIFLKKKNSKNRNSINILDLYYNDNIFNKHDDVISYTKEILPAQKEWYNTIYSYNKNYEKNIPIYDKIVSELIKSFFNLHFVRKMKTEKLSWRKKRIRRKRLTINRILLSKAEILHTNKKAFFNLYIYNGEKRYLVNKLKKINFVAKLRKKRIGRYIRKLKKKVKKIFFLTKKINKILRKKNTKFINLLTRNLKQNTIFISLLKRNLKQDLTFTIKNKKKQNPIFRLPLLRGNLKQNVTFRSKKNFKSIKLIIKNLKTKSNMIKIFNYKLYSLMLKNLIKKSQKKSRLINRINRYKHLLWINKSKFENTYIYSLYKIISKYYDKKIEFNIINLKYLHLNSSILSQSLAIKIKNRKNRLIRVIKKFLKTVKLPLVSNKVKIIFRKKSFWLSKISNTSDTLTSINYKYLYAFFSMKKNSIDFKENEQYDILNQLLKKKIQFKNEKKKYLISRILKTIKNKWVYGVKLNLSGRLTRRFVAARSISKINYKGNLRNVDSSYKGFPSVILRGYLKSNIQYSKISSKRKIGSFGVKGWISSL